MNYIFVAIEFLAFSKNAKFHFYLSSELLLFGTKYIYTPYVKMIFLLFVYIQMSWKRKFLYLNVHNNESHQEKTTCKVLGKKRKQIAKHLHIYIQSDTLCKKQENVYYVFIHKNPETLGYENFHEIFGIVIYIYTKSLTLWIKWPFYKQKFRLKK